VPEREPDPGFTVVDRRRRAEEEPPARPAAVPQAQAPPPPAGAAPPPAGVGPPGAATASPPGAARTDLTSLLVMLYSDAMASLGQAPDPASGQPHVDLEQARFAIDLLGMLQEKTQGNRTPEESAVLEEMLTTLRMGFVQLSQGRRRGR
jgi:hypothetical protein